MFNVVKEAVKDMAIVWNRGRDGKTVRLTFIQKDDEVIVKRERLFFGSFRKVGNRWSAYFGNTMYGICSEYNDLLDVVMSYIEMNCDIFGNQKCVETRYKEQRTKGKSNDKQD